MNDFRAIAVAVLGALILTMSGCFNNNGGGTGNNTNGNTTNGNDTNGNNTGSDEPPTASATVTTASPLMAGATIALSGSASTDPESQPLTYTWTLTAKPAGSAATLSPDSNDPAAAQFVADTDGTYTVHLEVKDPASLSGTADIDVVVDKARWGQATWGANNFSTP